MICTMRDQDGGAHVDGSISDEEYYNFSLWGDLTLKYALIGPNGQELKPIKYGVQAIIRQIAWEAEQSLSRIGL